MGQVDLHEMLKYLPPEQTEELKRILLESEQSSSDKSTKKRRSRKQKKQEEHQNNNPPKQGRTQAKSKQVGRSKPKNQSSQRQKSVRRGRAKPGGRPDGKPAKTESVVVGDRPNLFVEQYRQFVGPPTDEELQAIQFDKEVARKTQPTPRTRPSTIIEAQCDVCGLWFDVPASIARVDSQGNTRFKCNDCQIGGRRESE